MELQAPPADDGDRTDNQGNNQHDKHCGGTDIGVHRPERQRDERYP
jgi:hypothetical protein